ncbi:DUF4142 domain-containing protein [Chelativorans sp. Marseille-P2723]|uniref:DUF4142 domain-containing protein n=1 Tax=Chelativorans sp. Marseille-P2723 TaxID=2709133 RepID=UPI00156DE92A|nr:DUF4142 domain-containing protein [Chelativorans sp. Marseille-P2723]
MRSYLVIIGASAALLFGGAVGAHAQDAPSDPQIAHIAYTAGAIDIEAAKLALSKSETQAVLDFAQSMVNDHEAVNAQALALVEKLGVTPEDNPTSQSLMSAAETKRAELAELEGADFDQAYIENEVAFHAQVNDALETVLIPSAENEELKSFLETGLKLFQGHQQHAEQIAGELK